MHKHPTHDDAMLKLQLRVHQLTEVYVLRIGEALKSVQRENKGNPDIDLDCFAIALAEHMIVHMEAAVATPCPDCGANPNATFWAFIGKAMDNVMERRGNQGQKIHMQG